MGLFKLIRISILLVICAVVGVDSWITRLRTTDWDEPLRVVIYPINGDKRLETQQYISGLKESDFKSIEQFFSQQAGIYQIGIQKPFTVALGPSLEKLPPSIPRGNPIDTITWSLEIRYWAYQVLKQHREWQAEIQVFVVYHSPEHTTQLDHSVGLQKALVGIVNAYAGKRYKTRNNFVIAHELLHTVGATDKYDYDTNLPIFPQGYAEPARQPLYPQNMAEIMGGRIPLSKDDAVIPPKLGQVIIGLDTAKEIKWIN